MKFRTRTAAALCAIVALSFLAAPLARAEADLSSPKAAAMTFAKAVESNNAADIKAASVGAEAEQKNWLAMAGFMGAAANLKKAMTDKFGPEGAAVVPMETDALSKEVAKVEEKIDGDSATLMKKVIEDEDDKKPLNLKKIDGKWKVDLDTFPNKEQMAPVIAMFSKLTPAMESVAADVKAGKYATLLEAAMALQAKMQGVGAPE